MKVASCLLWAWPSFSEKLALAATAGGVFVGVTAFETADGVVPTALIAVTVNV